jgi:hypothetical protein
MMEVCALYGSMGKDNKYQNKEKISFIRRPGSTHIFPPVYPIAAGLYVHPTVPRSKKNHRYLSSDGNG